MIPTLPGPRSASDELADQAVEAIAALRRCRDLRCKQGDLDSYLLTSRIAELETLVELLLRTPAGQLRYSQSLLKLAQLDLGRLAGHFDA